MNCKAVSTILRNVREILAGQMEDINLFALLCLFHENKELKDIPFSAFRVSRNNTDNGKITSVTLLLESFIRW